jgi:hypothetical protein
MTEFEFGKLKSLGEQTEELPHIDDETIKKLIENPASLAEAGDLKTQIRLLVAATRYLDASGTTDETILEKLKEIKEQSKH